MRKVYSSLFGLVSGVACIVACSSAPEPSAEPVAQPAPAPAVESAPVQAAAAPADTAKGPALPASYKDIVYPEYKYVAPYPKDYRVEIAEGISGYIVADSSLPLVNLSVYFDNPEVASTIKDAAASGMVGAMFRRGGSTHISAHALDDTLEFISAGLSTSSGTWISSFSIDCLSKDFASMLDMAGKVISSPAFDAKQLEIVKTNYVTSHEQRYDTPAKVLSALRTKVNYAPNPRLWDPTLEEYKKVSVNDMKRLSVSTFASKHIVFALSGDVKRDSAVAMLKEFFATLRKSADAKAKPSPYSAPQPLVFLNKPGTYVVDKDITQANISMNQPFVKRPHADYYPTAVANFILGGGSFASRLMTRVRSDEGLAYHISSRAGNDYRDTAMISISLQTKVESAAFALKLVFEEIEKLAKDGPTEEELAMAKKTLVESLPGLFDSPSSTAAIFAGDELLGKSPDHYLDYVKEINAVTADQVKAMIAKYYAKDKMTISVVGPVSKLESLKPFTVVPLDSLEFR
ncbi:pitrilysin family protein [Fibrobacter sp.]|uniref:M16 family metallopeptidase n=1 Tax=Fibrobacter sp. TaxID=35828 RepID=UPI0025C1B54F|nr:pitrilysin family protein [Fibrobacter sp.]MBR4007629.1 insulinase family protein [Fibrobacter sp.]